MVRTYVRTKIFFVRMNIKTRTYRIKFCTDGI